MDSKNYHEDLSHIRSMMERSSRFISLSGLSGVVAGVVALLGAGYAYYAMEREKVSYIHDRKLLYSPALVQELVLTGLVVLVIAILSGYIFTANKSKKKGLKIWDATTKRLIVTFAIPLAAGGIFCAAMIFHHLFVWIAPVTLIFYGLALVSAERYTLPDIKYLGYCEIILGLIASFVLGWGLLFWSIGFGALHIVYGLIMHKKYK
jgi:predicted lysophospholipase L1 biosynthesis ABC-type transport system permease subunit